jgi:two-component system chemotaxis response regulator CheB
MPPIRVLIVDDSVVIRQVLSELFLSDPEIEIAGTASSGALALSLIPQLKPDLVTLDLEMPGMDGLETLAAAAGQADHVFPLPAIASEVVRRGTASRQLANSSWAAVAR